MPLISIKVLNPKINNFGGILICGIIGFSNLKLIKLQQELLNGLLPKFDHLFYFYILYYFTLFLFL